MSGLLALLILALAAAALTALLAAVVALLREHRLDARRALATGALAVVTATAAVTGIAALQPPAPAPVSEPATAVVVQHAPSLDVQLPTIALD